HFAAIVLDKLTVKDSPKEIKDQLELSGVRPLNNLIDITNYLTLCFGQPVHIFDYNKIVDHQMILRESQKGEKIITLDGKTHVLKGGDIVIEDGEGRLIDLCGIMGGKLSEVDEGTKRAVLFVQTYNPKKIRRTSLYTQERTLAAQIFEKQPDSRLVIPTLIEGVNLLVKHASAVVAGDSIDHYFQKPIPKTIKLDLKRLNRLIGYEFDSKTTSTILTNLGFTVKKISATSFETVVPSWRLHDVAIPEDLAEEIARVYGYFRLESKLPITANLSVTSDPLLDWEYQTKKYLSDLGFTEIFNYSLVSKELFERALMARDHSVILTNPLSSEFEYMRPSLIPSLLMDLEKNQGKVDLPLRIFELSNIYIPKEQSILAFATQGVDYRHAKGYLEALLQSLHLTNINFVPLKEDSGPWQKNQTGEIYSDKHLIGIMGAIKPKVKASFNLNGDIYLANLDFQIVSSLANTNYSYTPISDYPDMIEDITIQSNQSIGKILQLIKQESQFITKVIYRTSLINKHTFTIHFNDSKKNLTQNEVNKIKESLLKRSQKE
ncbi:phenylalanine--tRNA ligase subunit beta, partial [Candidatus Collierbacteria bacterium]|nr:phenylalanine--tRNA ligase subunit beta [Candidatus Collierbacteria bacterium]